MAVRALDAWEAYQLSGLVRCIKMEACDCFLAQLASYGRSQLDRLNRALKCPLAGLCAGGMRMEFLAKAASNLEGPLLPLRANL